MVATDTNADWDMQGDREPRPIDPRLAELSITGRELELCREKLRDAEAEIEHCRADSQRLHIDLGKTREALEQARSDRDSLYSTLEQSRASLEHSNRALAAARANLEYEEKQVIKQDQNLGSLKRRAEGLQRELFSITAQRNNALDLLERAKEYLTELQTDWEYTQKALRKVQYEAEWYARRAETLSGQLTYARTELAVVSAQRYGMTTRLAHVEKQLRDTKGLLAVAAIAGGLSIGGRMLRR